MLKFKLSTKIFMVIAFFSFILFLVFVSVLGINNNAQSDVKQFIQNMSSKNYTAALQFYTEKEKARQKSFYETMKFHFTLELAMLEYFDLMENPKYSIKIERENMWIPLLTPNELKVSVTLTPQKDTNMLSGLFSKAKQKPLKKFITLVRENEKWKISHIHIEDSELESIFKRIQPNVSVGKYVSLTPKGFVLKETNLDLEKISPLERKILVRDLQTAMELLDKSDVKQK